MGVGWVSSEPSGVWGAQEKGCRVTGINGFQDGWPWTSHFTSPNLGFLFLFEFYFLKFTFYLFFLFRVRSMSYEVPRLRVKLELQLPAYATATAMWDLSHICDLHHSSWQLNPWIEARGQTRILMDASQVHFHWATMRTPQISLLNWIFFLTILFDYYNYLEVFPFQLA